MEGVLEQRANLLKRQEVARPCSIPESESAMELPFIDVDTLSVVVQDKMRHAKASVEGGDDYDFFQELAVQISMVAIRFEEEALRVLQLQEDAQKAQEKAQKEKRTVKFWLKKMLPRRGASHKGAHDFPDAEELARMAAEVRSYALKNSETLEKLVEQYEGCYNTGTAATFMKKCKLQRGRDNFLRSWLLDELAALAHAHDTSAWKEDACKDAEAGEFGELACGICLDLCFKPIKLGCGHKMCHVCLANSAKRSVLTPVMRLPRDFACPFCRQEDVCMSAVSLKECDVLASKAFPEQYNERMLDYNLVHARELFISISTPMLWQQRNAGPSYEELQLWRIQGGRLDPRRGSPRGVATWREATARLRGETEGVGLQHNHHNTRGGQSLDFGRSQGESSATDRVSSASRSRSLDIRPLQEQQRSDILSMPSLSRGSSTAVAAVA